MGLFDGGAKKILRDGIPGTATIREAEQIHDDGTDEHGQRGEFFLNDLRDAGFWGKHRYLFTLDVAVEGSEPYEVSGEFKTPAKAGKTGLLSHRGLNAGLELPVKVDRSDPQKLAIDWEAFLADPDSKKAVKRAASEGSVSEYRQMLDSDPALASTLREGNKVAVIGWAGMVQSGDMSREEFDKSVDLEVKTGRMDPADAEAARAKLDGTA
jgi:hypothetical protein